MIDSHVQVTLTCDDCGTVVESEDYDQLGVEAAEQKALVDYGWIECEQTHLCPDCQGKGLTN